MYRKLKWVERDVRLLTNRAKYLAKDTERLSKDIQEIINEEKEDALKYKVVDANAVMAVGDWPFGNEEEVEINLPKWRKVKYKRLGSDEVYFGKNSVLIGGTKINVEYFEDALRLICAIAHKRYHKNVYKDFGFAYYIAGKENPVFIVYNYLWYVAIAPLVEEE